MYIHIGTDANNIYVETLPRLYNALPTLCGNVQRMIGRAGSFHGPAAAFVFGNTTQVFGIAQGIFSHLNLLPSLLDPTSVRRIALIKLGKNGAQIHGTKDLFGRRAVLFVVIIVLLLVVDVVVLVFIKNRVVIGTDTGGITALTTIEFSTLTDMPRRSLGVLLLLIEKTTIATSITLLTSRRRESVLVVVAVAAVVITLIIIAISTPICSSRICGSSTSSLGGHYFLTWTGGGQ